MPDKNPNARVLKYTTDKAAEEKLGKMIGTGKVKAMSRDTKNHVIKKDYVGLFESGDN